ncbi:LPXTG cell wall anchor domain-containing protein, partial [Streptomyces mirabilis]|uniref:LPXTG cell wall anchor domain-containing protein n=1 Tax=Streptomyces mirabilis TaxID=68239 RepID=UPI0033EDEFC0
SPPPLPTASTLAACEPSRDLVDRHPASATGADQTMPAVAASAALLLGGAVLYRRFRPTGVR